MNSFVAMERLPIAGLESSSTIPTTNQSDAQLLVLLYFDEIKHGHDHIQGTTDNNSERSRIVTEQAREHCEEVRGNKRTNTDKDNNY